MAREVITNTRRLNAKAAINSIKIESLPYFYYSGNAQVIPWGLDNLYPYRINQAIRFSPTALGCVKRQSEFIFGNGDQTNGNIVVNRDGETLNDILWQCIRFGYSTLYGFGLHLNFNALGQIAEIFFVSGEYIRKHRNLKQAEYGVWHDRHENYAWYNNITVDMYGAVSVYDRLMEYGTREYKGQLFMYSKDNEIYPTSPLHSANIAASYEKEAQLYPYANIANGFSGNTIVKLPNIGGDPQAVKNVEEQIRLMHGAENAGSSMVIETPVRSDGTVENFQMIESFSHPSVDGLFVNQNAKAERDILKVYNMPEILLGVSSKGMFNESSFNDAFNYKNSDTEIDRKSVERTFSKILQKSVWQIENIELTPLQLRQNINNITQNR